MTRDCLLAGYLEKRQVEMVKTNVISFLYLSTVQVENNT